MHGRGALCETGRSLLDISAMGARRLREQGNSVKKPAKSNIYLDIKLADLQPFDAAIDGGVDAEACIVSYGPLPDAVRAALCAACASMEMPEPVCVDVSLVAPADVLAVIEGLDPVALIAADEFAAQLLGDAYRAKVALDAHSRLLGRSVVAFTSFEADLESARMKQRDWALLKLLKK